MSLRGLDVLELTGTDGAFCVVFALQFADEGRVSGDRQEAVLVPGTDALVVAEHMGKLDVFGLTRATDTGEPPTSGNDGVNKYGRTVGYIPAIPQFPAIPGYPELPQDDK